MKKWNISFAILSIAILLYSCAPKLNKGATTNNATDPAYATFVSNFNQEQIQTGKTLHDTNCGKCHKIKDISNFSIEKWDRILDRMIPKAKLSADDGKLVRAYIYNLKIIN